MIVREITNYIESFAPLAYQEDYDNAGLIIGNPDQEVTSALITVDVTEEIMAEAMQNQANLIISHHPLIFGGIKKLTGKHYTERIVINAIKNNIAIYAVHTNVDNVLNGVNQEIGKRLNLKSVRILKPKTDLLYKLVTFVPGKHIDEVQKAVFKAGAGQIGNYDSCSYNLEGYGTFRAGEGTNPFVGEQGEIHKETEIRFETIFEKKDKDRIRSALIESHPYEEVAYDLYPLANEFPAIGAGIIGEPDKAVDERSFLHRVKEVFEVHCIRHTKLLGKNINKVAVCGGSGSFLLNDAIQQKADIFISADFKYHQFFEADNKILIADIGHYESEQFTKELIYHLLTKKFPKFAVRLSKVNTNPIKYL